jgi:hypothetical protein
MFYTSISLKTEDCEGWGSYISVNTVYTDNSKECAASIIDADVSYLNSHYLENFKSHSVLRTVPWREYATTVSMICKTQNKAAVYIQNKQRALLRHLVIYVCTHALHNIKPASKHQPGQNLQWGLTDFTACKWVSCSKNWTQHLMAFDRSAENLLSTFPLLYFTVTQPCLIRFLSLSTRKSIMVQCVSYLINKTINKDFIYDF